MSRIGYFRLATLIWALVILVLTVIPTEDVPITFSGSDKIAHSLIYAILSFILYGSLTWSLRARFILTIIASSIYGIGTELLQNLIPGRNADIYDLIFNIIGAICGATIFYFVAKKIPV